MPKVKVLTLFFLLCFGFTLFSQTFLRVSTNKFGRTKTYHIYLHEVLEYKLKGDLLYHKHKLIALSDSTLMFDNYTEAKFSEIKAVKLNVQNHLIYPLRFVFMGGGLIFLPLNSLNNYITDTQPVYNERAAYISAALITTSVLIKQLGIRRLRLGKNTDLKTLSIDYQNLNTKDSLR